MPSKCKNCQKLNPTFNYPTKTNGQYCCNCRLPDMVNVVLKRCDVCKIISPNFNYPDKKKQHTVRDVN